MRRFITCWQCGQVHVAVEVFSRRMFMPCFTRLVTQAGCRSCAGIHFRPRFRGGLPQGASTQKSDRC